MGVPRHRTPPTPLLLRRRLLQRLAGSWKVALLVAPAGYGKSTLAAQYAAKTSALWCRLSRDDRDLAHLLGRFIASGLRAAPPLTGRTDRLFRARRDLERDGGLITSSLLAEISAGSGGRLIVLEDLHLLAGAREVLGWLRRIIEESDPGLRFLITSRSPCPLPLARLELQMNIVRLGPEDLEFNEEEQGAFFRSAGTRTLDPATRAALRASLRGWPAGLVLAAPGATHRRPPEVADSTAQEERTVRLFRFLAEEVFEPLPAELRSSLCRLSLLEELDPDQIDFVLGAKMGARFRLEMTRQELFLRGGHGGEERAAFHPLFREFLRERLREQLSAAEARNLGRRVARHLVRNGEPLRAVRVLLDTGDSEGAVRAFERCAEGPGAQSIQTSLAATADGLLRHARERSIATRSAWVLYHAGVSAYREGRPAEAGEHIAAAQDLWLQSRAYTQIAGSARAAVACAWTTGHHAPLLARLRRLLTCVPARERLVRGVLTAELGGTELIAGHPTQARRHLAEAERVLQGTPEELPLLEIRLTRANLLFTQGHWDRYLHIAQSVLAIFRRMDLPGKQQALLVNMAEAMTYLGEEERALSTLSEAGELQSRVTLGNAPLIALSRARALVESGDPAAANRALTEASQAVLGHGSPLWEHQIDLWNGVLLRRQGRLKTARERLTAAVEGFRRVDSPSWSNVAEMELALVLGLLRVEDVRPRLSKAAAESRRLGDQKEVAKNLLFQARVQQVTGEDPAPLFRRALRLLERERYLVLLRKEADLTVPLLRAATDLPAALRRLVESTLRGPAAIPAAVPAAARGAAPGKSKRRVVSGPEQRAAKATLQIRLLGGLEVSSNGQPLIFPRRASAHLLARLALRPGIPQRREELAEALWPGAGAAQSRNRFDVALNAARRAIEPEAGPRGPFRILESTGGWCRLVPEMVTVDVSEFEAAVRRCADHLRDAAGAPHRRQLGEPARARSGRGLPDATSARRAAADLTVAIEIYRGDLLPDLVDAEWTQRDRERWRDQHTRLLLARAEHRLSLGQAEAAAADARAVIERDPLEEKAQQIHLRALCACGRHLEAVRACRRFAKRIRLELGVPPSPETVELFHAAVEAIRRRPKVSR